MNKPVTESWLEKLVKNYRIPTGEVKSNKILTESQIKIIKNTNILQKTIKIIITCLYIA